MSNSDSATHVDKTTAELSPSASKVETSSTTTIQITESEMASNDQTSEPTATEASYSNSTPQELTVKDTSAPETTIATTEIESATTATTTTTTTTTVLETIPTTEDSITQTEQTQVHTTTAEPVTAGITYTTQNAQDYTTAPAPNTDHQQITSYNQLTTDIQSIAASSTLAITDATVASVNPSVVTSSTSATVISTSTCISNSAETSSNSCTSASEEEAVAKMTVAEIAGIVAGILVLFSLIVACILVKKRKKRRGNFNNKRRISPFFYMNDQPDQEKNPNYEKLDNSRAALCQTYKNEQPTITNSSVSDMSESVCGDNIFYSNSTNYHGLGNIMNQNGVNEKLKVITSPAESYQQHTTGYYDSSPLKTNASYTVEAGTPTTLYPHIKRTESSEFNKFTNTNPYSKQQASRSSTELDTNDYTLSAMQLFQPHSNRNTTTTAGSMSPMGSFISNSKMQQYRPSLHESMFLASQNSSNGSSVDESSTIQSLPIAQKQPRFSRHHRQESSLDPHFYEQSHQKMSLWDDHLN